MTSSESPPATEVNGAIRELAGIFAGALLRLRRPGHAAETSATLAQAAFSPVEVPADTALSAPDGL